MKENTQLALEPKRELAPVSQPSIIQILSAAVQGGVTAENVAVVEKLLAIREREQAAEAQRDFARDFAKLQAATDPVKATKAVANKDGSARFRYAPYEEIMAEVRPLLTDNGFSVMFDTRISDDGKRCAVTCKLIHASGHISEGQFSARIGQGPPGSSEAQGDGAAASYARRVALCNMLNIVTEDVNSDARGSESAVTPAEAEELRAGFAETGAVEKTVLQWLGATSFADVPANRLAEARAKIADRRAKGAPKAATNADPEKTW